MTFLLPLDALLYTVPIISAVLAEIKMSVILALIPITLLAAFSLWTIYKHWND